MELAEARDAAWRCHRVLDPLHSMIYFAPEAEERLTGAGLRPGRMCYFASRSAAFGAVGPGVVAATFYNFNPVLVARHIPRAWTLASPADIIAARFEAVDGALRRLLGEEAIASPEMAEAAELARAASEGCYPDGRPLYAAHANLDWPTEPHLVLWHAISLLREFRGDGHIAALVSNGLDGLPALITHTATGRGFIEDAAKTTRGWSDDEWAVAKQSLVDDGIIEDNALTEKGNQLRQRIEDTTNDLTADVWVKLGPDKASRLHDLGRTFARQVSAAGAFPGIFSSRR
jgi:hypothetical protein